MVATALGFGQWPAPDPEWHPIAQQFYLALQHSGQAAFYEPSDVAYAFLFVEAVHRLLNGAGTRSGVGLSGQTLAAVDSMASKLLVTESDRRRLQIELRSEEPESPSVGIMAKYRANLAVPTVN